MKDISKKTTHRKPVQYRARHKNLRNLKEEDTKHGFEERINVQRSQGHASEPVFCGVWPLNGHTESIELNSSNYRFAATKLEDSIRVVRPSNKNRASRSAISASPSSSTYSADMALQESEDNILYYNEPIQLTRTEEILGFSQPHRYPHSTTQGGFPLPIPEIQHNYLPTVQEETFDIHAPGYTGYAAIAYANQGIPGDVQISMDPYNLNLFFYPEVHQPYRGMQSTSNEPIMPGWEPDSNHIWNHTMVDGYLYDQGSNAPNISTQYPEFNFPVMVNNQYMPHHNHPNVNVHNGYHTGL